MQLVIETKDGLKYTVSRAWGEDPIILTSEGRPTELADLIRQRDTKTLIDRAELNHDQAGKVMMALSGSAVLLELESGDLVDLFHGSSSKTAKSTRTPRHSRRGRNVRPFCRFSCWIATIHC